MSETTAFTLDAEERQAWLIVFGEHEGGEFDWTVGRWKEKAPRIGATA